MQHGNDPTEFVEAWIRRNIQNQSKEHMNDLFIRAIDALWRRCFTTLGEITLSAIFDRVLFGSRRSFPWIGSFTLKSDEFTLDPLPLKSLTVDALEKGMSSVLIDLLKVIGNLTGHALTPHLTEELTKLEGTRVKPEGEI